MVLVNLKIDRSAVDLVGGKKQPLRLRTIGDAYLDSRTDTISLECVIFLLGVTCILFDKSSLPAGFKENSHLNAFSIVEKSPLEVLEKAWQMPSKMGLGKEREKDIVFPPTRVVHKMFLISEDMICSSIMPSLE
jgi:hypothetical protein